MGKDICHKREEPGLLGGKVGGIRLEGNELPVGADTGSLATSIYRDIVALNAAQLSGAGLPNAQVDIEREGIPHQGPFARLTIEVHTSLEFVGLTALLATELAKSEIPANVIAPVSHDHIFAPYELRRQAIKAITRLARNRK